MQSLADFLNHGILPFMGRDVEMRRILDFWRGTFQATELRGMLVTGEAGIGKSRLLEQVTQQIVDAGGSVVHVKLYAESTASFVSLVARSLWHGEAERSILGEEPEPKLGPVANALQRLARLRPTLLVLEDLHLLGTEALPEFSRLLAFLADETISLLALARPVELQARRSLEPYITSEFTLQGLPREDCARVWEEVSGSATGPEVAAALHDATAGNPLALRSALRGVLNSDNGTEKRWASAQSAVALTQTLKRTVGLLADGMTVHLSAEELEGATRLALLGEVFSREAAAILLDNAESLIESLSFNGIIATAIAPPDPLPGQAGSSAPLAFTHALLHRQLINNASFEADPIVRVIADGPLYSLLPLRKLSEKSWIALSLDTDTIMRAYDRAVKVEIAICRTAHWGRAAQVWDGAVRLLATRLGTWKQDDWERMLVKLIHHKLNLVRREPREKHIQWLEYLDSVTSVADSDELIKGRLNLLTSRDLLYSPGRPELTHELWEEAEALIEVRPHLRYTFAYTDYVIAACIDAFTNGDTEMLRRIETRADELLASPDLPDAVRTSFRRKVRPPLLKLYENEEQLTARLEQIAEFEKTVEKSDLSVWMFCLDLLAEVAAVGMLKRICEAILPILRQQGTFDLVAHTVAREQSVLAGTYDSFSSVTTAFTSALEEMPQWNREQVESAVAIPIVDAALLRNDPNRAREIIEQYSIALQELHPIQRIMLAIHAPDHRSAFIAARSEGTTEGALAQLLDLLIDGAEAGGIPAFEVLLRTPVLGLMDTLRTSAVVEMIDLAERQKLLTDVPENLAMDIGEALVRSLEWFAAPERGLFAYMKPLLARGRKYLTPKQLATWQKKINELEELHSRTRQITSSGRLKLSMLGTITARTPDGQMLRFQGARARMLLAMMVANQMLPDPLSSTEFGRLAAGDDEIDRARDVVKTTVHRIREQTGRDAILTEGQAPPGINREIMDVDLLEAHELLKRAGEALRRSSPMQAKVALMSALEITHGEVPFPSLYDDFIEAVRQDFENNLRTTTIAVVKALIREGGVDDAAEVLQPASNAMPGDEELSDLLQQTLLNRGRHAEASRVKMNSEADC